MTDDEIKEQLKQVKYPGFSRDIVSFGLVRSASFADGKAHVSLALTTNDPKIPLHLKAEVDKCLRALPGVRETAIDIAVQPQRTAAAGGGNLAGGGAKKAIRYAIAIGSGKGGVGKSTFAVNLACAMAQVLSARGSPGRVGLMDCDIYGPSVPLMIGLEGRPEVEGDGPNAMLIPMEKHGVKVMSMGFLVDENTPVVWRGPMIMKTIQQFVQNVKWGELEILIVDLPPGTGDAQLSLVQTLPIDGALIVTTPQPAAANVARKGGPDVSKGQRAAPRRGGKYELFCRSGRDQAHALRRERRPHHRGEAGHGSPRPDPAHSGDTRGRRSRAAGGGGRAAEPRRGKIPGHGGGRPRPPGRAGQPFFVTFGKNAGIDRRPRGALISSASVYRCMSPSSKEPDSSSRDFVKQSSLYQEFLAEREEILKHKWLESERLGYDVGFERALLDWIRKHREGWRAARRHQLSQHAGKSSAETRPVAMAGHEKIG
jgi:ATP-binding protein involved in chromosome partitioning